MYKPIGERCLEELLSVVENEKKVKKVIDSYSKIALTRALKTCKGDYYYLNVLQEEEFDEHREDKIKQLHNCGVVLENEIKKRKEMREMVKNNKENGSLTPKVAAKHELERAIKLANKAEREFENPNAEYVSADLESVEPEEKETSTVDHPQHYNVGSVETIDVIEGLGWGQGFNLGNALKYLMRCEHKGKKKEDLEKAMWYIKRELENIEEEK